MRAIATRDLLGPDGVPGLFHHLEEMFSQIVRAGKSAVGPIKGYASLIQDDNVRESNSAWWSRKIERNANEFDRYLNHLAMLCLRDAVDVDCATFDDILRYAVTGATSASSCGVRVEIANAAPRPFVQQTQLISRIIYHGVRNAVEAARERVAISVLETTVADGHRIGREFTVRITDDGPGVERRSKKLVWKPFFSTRPDHLGLGLPYIIAASAVVDVSVELSNRPDGGAEMTLVFRDKGDQR